MILSQSVKAMIGLLFFAIGAALAFGPFLSDDERSLVGCAFLIGGLLFSERPRHDDDSERPSPITWAERDGGQRFSIIMFHIVILTFAAAISWTMTTGFDAWYGPVLGALTLTTTIWLTFRNWKNRNAS